MAAGIGQVLRELKMEIYPTQEELEAMATKSGYMRLHIKDENRKDWRVFDLGRPELERLVAHIIDWHTGQLRKQEPVGSYMGHGCISWHGEYDMHETKPPKQLPVGTKLFAAPVPAPAVPEGWQPIETAPHIGAHLACEINHTNTRRPYVIVWLDADHPDTDGAGWHEHWNLDPVEPTHWMPLPQPPKEQA